MARLQACRRLTVHCVGFALLLVAQPLRITAQDPRAFLNGQAEVIDPTLGDGQSTDDPNYRGRPRYAEPDPPPFDYWQPTWMPCQSLRTNRSLVLGHLYWGADILGWSAKGVHAPPLVTTAPGNTATPLSGAIGQPDTRVVFGNETFHEDLRPGGRLTIGWWFDPNQYSGIEFQYFELDGHDLRYKAVSNNGQVIARPVIDASTGDETAVQIASPGTSTGSIDATSVTQLTSTGILFRDLLWASPISRLDYLIGYRHTHLYDRLRIDDTSTLVGAAVPTTDRATDQFRAINQFDGADFGLKGWWSNTGKLALTSIGKIALGATNNTVLVSGQTVNTMGTGRTATHNTFGSDLLALPSNIGRYDRQNLGYVAEVGAGLEWRPACYWKFNLG
ncbi:MAG: BBP7 family outer membrane beta-barrel protein, partial [Planctomycetia bacterium]|nr:BBP7 family outer membrane beta-barrel protein [Planctomycetia bacterium]